MIMMMIVENINNDGSICAILMSKLNISGTHCDDNKIFHKHSHYNEDYHLNIPKEVNYRPLPVQTKFPFSSFLFYLSDFYSFLTVV